MKSSAAHWWKSILCNLKWKCVFFVLPCWRLMNIRVLLVFLHQLLLIIKWKKSKCGKCSYEEDEGQVEALHHKAAESLFNWFAAVTEVIWLLLHAIPLCALQLSLKACWDRNFGLNWNDFFFLRSNFPFIHPLLISLPVLPESLCSQARPRSCWWKHFLTGWKPPNVNHNSQAFKHFNGFFLAQMSLFCSLFETFFETILFYFFWSMKWDVN